MDSQGCLKLRIPPLTTFLINGKGGLRGVDWTFNAWGGLDGGLYSEWQRDDEVAQKILEIERCDRYRTEGFVLEGGSIHVDGAPAEQEAPAALGGQERRRTEAGTMRRARTLGTRQRACTCPSSSTGSDPEHVAKCKRKCKRKCKCKCKRS